MPELILAIGNCNYSSWSLRAWLAIEQTGLPFREEIIWFDEDRDRRQRKALSPTGRVPVLLHGKMAIWDSLAIGEYLAELAPEAGLWPDDRMARARARSLCAEMHAGFPAVRATLPLNMRRRMEQHREHGTDVDNEVRRLTSMWTDTRQMFGDDGPFLFGRRTLADAFFAPVASRFRTYGISLKGEAEKWAETVLNLPAMRTWAERANAEGHPNPAYDALLLNDGAGTGPPNLE
ncbi:MAG: glutathione S-transferase family protein [Acidobacteria bacterium]|nr:glutathione S-transferase family protein [Acidobacteriota bacterium]